MEKMMTLMEAWQGVPLKQTIGVEDAFAHGFASGRQGMIPAENAVVIPDVSEWPDDAIAIHFSYASATACYSGMQIISRIPRPKPVWVPKVGEAVFFCTTDLTGQVARVIGFEIDHPNCWSVINADGNTILPSKEHVKPFHPDHIGKPWSEIPGGVE